LGFGVSRNPTTLYVNIKQLTNFLKSPKLVKEAPSKHHEEVVIDDASMMSCRASDNTISAVLWYSIPSHYAHMTVTPGVSKIGHVMNPNPDRGPTHESRGSYLNVANAIHAFHWRGAMSLNEERQGWPDSSPSGVL
jgi:hypothetical protein